MFPFLHAGGYEVIHDKQANERKEALPLCYAQPLGDNPKPAQKHPRHQHYGYRFSVRQTQTQEHVVQVLTIGGEGALSGFDPAHHHGHCIDERDGNNP